MSAVFPLEIIVQFCRNRAATMALRRTCKFYRRLTGSGWKIMHLYGGKPTKMFTVFGAGRYQKCEWMTHTVVIDGDNVYCQYDGLINFPWFTAKLAAEFLLLGENPLLPFHAVRLSIQPSDMYNDSIYASSNMLQVVGDTVEECDAIVHAHPTAVPLTIYPHGNYPYFATYWKRAVDFYGIKLNFSTPPHK